MPRIPDNMEEVKLPASHYGYTKVQTSKLGADNYTLVTLAVDESGSVGDFASEIEKCVKEAVNGCRFSPRADNLLLRTVAFASRMREHHGFKLLQDCNETDYDNFYQDNGKANTGATTALYDTCENVVAAMNDMGEKLTSEDYNVNGIFIIITDGCDNESSLTVKDVQKRLKEAKEKEKMESLLSILVAVNVKEDAVLKILEAFKDKAGITQFVNLGDASSKKLAKLAAFISKSVTSQSSSINTGKASQPLAI